MNNYQERQADKVDRLTAAASRKRAEGEAQAGEATDFFFRLNGQPMLPGHHSYPTDRNRRRKNRDRLDAGYRKIAAAAELDRRANSVGTGGIASDDPAAIAKLERKLEAINEERGEIKAVNRLVRNICKRTDRPTVEQSEAIKAALEEAGYSHWITDAVTPDYGGRIGIESFVLSNLTAKARATEKRIAELEEMAKVAVTEWTTDGWSLWTDDDAGRIYLEIDGALTKESWKSIKQAGGFNWSRHDQRFVRKITPNAIKAATALAGRLDDMIEAE